jgi:arylformamidase
LFTRFVDISILIENGMQVYPGDPVVEITPFSSIREDGFSLTELHLGTHTGTHADFRAHVIEAEAIKPSLSILIGACMVVHAKDLEALSQDNGLIPERMIVKGGLPDFASCSRLICNGLKLIGVGEQSIEKAGSLDLHRLLLGAGVVILEGLALQEATEGPAFLMALPLSTEAADGSPARVVLAY